MHVMVLLLLVAGLALLVLGLMTGSTPLVVASIAASLLAAYLIVRVRRQQDSAAPVKASDAPTKAFAFSAKGSASSAEASASSTGASASEKARVGARVAVATAAPASAPQRPAHAHAASEPAHAAAEPVHAHAASEPAGIELVKAGTGPAETVAGRVDTVPIETATTGPDPAGTVSSDDPATPEPAVADTDPPLRSRGDEPVWVIDGRPRYHLPHCGFLLARQPEPVPLRQAVEDGFTPCALCDPDTGLTS